MECINPLYLSNRDCYVPCGRCGFCLATKRSDWSQRIMQEWKRHDVASFVTLTYANPHLTWKHNQPQLVKADLQKWLKRVRKAGYRIRYFAVGEYGSQTFRPHYHLILFGDVPEDFLRKSWGLGEIHVGKVSLASVAYCTKYVINSKIYAMKKNREPPFTVMSKKPGIGSNYLTKEMIQWHREGRKNYMLVDGVKRHLPKYYKDAIFSAIDKVRISNREQRASIERLRKELYKLRRHSNAMEYRDQMMREASRRIRNKSKQNLTI